MSSSPLRSGRALRPGRWSLRTRLLVEQILLLALVCVIIGVVTEVALGSHLLQERDSEVMTASNLSRGGGGGGGHDGPPPGGHMGAPPSACDGSSTSLSPFATAQGPQTLNAMLAGGTVVRAAQLTAQGCQRAVAAADSAPLAQVPTHGGPYTVTLGSLGPYRVLARTDPDTGNVQVTGLPASDIYQTLWDVGWILGGVAAGGLLIAGLAGAYIVRRNLRPLRRVADTAGRVAELPLDRGDVALSVRVPEMDTDPRTEVGQVGSALNRMLGHIAAALAARQASETRARQFVADASHELRTPLAAIRGYAELTRRGRDEVPPALAHAMGRVESEAARMTTLVEDLLLLARLDSGRPLERETVELSQLVVDAVSDAHIAGPEHAWRLDLPEEPVTVTGDGARLHQVLANLLTNARTHTPPGSTVTAGLAAEPHRVTVTVADDGPGIPPDVLPDVFERFARGDTSRSRAAGSTGLGLAIVSAVVGAHHGTVEVDSKPGNTVFTVRLPSA